MHEIINNYISKLSKFNEIEFSAECLYSLKNDEVIIHNKTILSQERALTFYQEKYDMQLYIEEERRLKGFYNLLVSIKKVDIEKRIRISNIIAPNSEYFLFEIEDESTILGILKNQLGSLEERKKYIDLLKDRKKTVSLSINNYRFIKGELIEEIN